MTLTLADIYAGLGGQQPSHHLAAVAVKRFDIDSRLCMPGSCFVALKGENTDGHRYIGAALAQGAVAVLAQTVPGGVQATVVRVPHDPAPAQAEGPVLFVVEDTMAALQRLAAFWRSRHDVTVVGITGSVGKTSTKELVASVLRQQFHTLWNEGNLNNEIGLPLTLLRIEPNHQVAVLEMGFYMEGEIAMLCALARPYAGVVTNVGPIHLERAGSIEAIFRGKSELVQALAPDGRAILNWDDEWVRRMAGLSPAPVFRYGLTPEADLWADQITSKGLEGIRFRFHDRTTGDSENVLHVHLPLLGRHAVHTALAAAAVGLVFGMTWEDIIRGLTDINAQIRIDVVPGINGSTLIDDTYNASPPSTIAALNLLADLSGRRIAVLGDMLELGSYSESGHRMVGRRAADVVDTLVTVGSLSQWIADEAVAGGLPPASVQHVFSPAEALELLHRIVQPGDYVLVKGSRVVGMESIVTALSAPSPDR